MITVRDVTAAVEKYLGKTPRKVEVGYFPPMGRLPGARRESKRLRDRDMTVDVLTKAERATLV